MNTPEIQPSSRPGSRSWRFLREPLLHFVVLGGLLFGGYYAVNDEPQTSDSKRIVIDEGQLASIVAIFQRTWLRPPTREELAGLVEERVKEEVLYREALALGMERDDPVVRRRMRQKIEFLNTDLSEPESPSDAELQAYLDANGDRFRTDERLSFTQVYLNEDAGEKSQKRAEALLQQLTGHPPSDAEVAQLGDATLLPAAMQHAAGRDIGSVFGKGLVEALSAAPAGRWSGPYASSYGQHLVYVSERQPAREPQLSEVRAEVEREWLAERQRENNQRFYQGLRDRYTVEVADPRPFAGDALAAVRP